MLTHTVTLLLTDHLGACLRAKAEPARQRQVVCGPQIGLKRLATMVKNQLGGSFAGRRRIPTA